MRNIYTIGETVLDIVFKNQQPVTAKAGGSMLNTAVSLGRLGLPIHFISEYATDTVGVMIDGFLTVNGVDTNNVYHYADGKSALALAFLDDKNNANYSFYKAYPPKRLDVTFPEVQADDIVMFGSFYGITYEIRDILKQFLVKARENGAIIIYDPNFRKSHLFELDRLKPAILENMTMASVVRCSDEDLELIFNVKDIDSAYNVVKPLCSNMVYTSSSKAVYLRTPAISETFAVKSIEPLSTIGAGDNFNAGVVYGLYKNKISGNDLSSLPLNIWEILINTGIDFATEVCLSYENYISQEFASQQAK
jgi:Sugar kinases, ribokinase family